VIDQLRLFDFKTIARARILGIVFQIWPGLEAGLEGWLYLVGIHSWDFNISDEATVSIRKRHLFGLVAAE
jgi:hypothetical protein